MRLQKYLAACGVASRRESERLIEAGQITINGTAATLGDSVDPDVDAVEYNGQPVSLDAKVYLVLNKPRGVVTTARDTHRRKTVLDCLDGVSARVFPVGRLDMDVEGALILTNDGELAHRLMHPSYGVEKVYMAWVRSAVSPETVARLEAGVDLDDGKTAPARVAVIESYDGASLLRLVLREGRKREVKRMCAAVGHPIRALRRISIGGVHTGNLQPGEWRYLSAGEVAALQQAAKLDEETPAAP